MYVPSILKLKYKQTRAVRPLIEVHRVVYLDLQVPITMAFGSSGRSTHIYNYIWYCIYIYTFFVLYIYICVYTFIICGPQEHRASIDYRPAPPRSRPLHSATAPRQRSLAAQQSLAWEDAPTNSLYHCPSLFLKKIYIYIYTCSTAYTYMYTYLSMCRYYTS